MNEKENTFRILKDEVPLMKSFWCRLGIHNWTMWGEPQSGVYTTAIAMNKRRALFQYRHCGNCNKVDRGMTLLGSVYD